MNAPGERQLDVDLSSRVSERWCREEDKRRVGEPCSVWIRRWGPSLGYRMFVPFSYRLQERACDNNRRSWLRLRSICGNPGLERYNRTLGSFWSLDATHQLRRSEREPNPRCHSLWRVRGAGSVHIKWIAFTKSSHIPIERENPQAYVCLMACKRERLDGRFWLNGDCWYEIQCEWVGIETIRKG